MNEEMFYIFSPDDGTGAGAGADVGAGAGAGSGADVGAAAGTATRYTSIKTIARTSEAAATRIVFPLLSRAFAFFRHEMFNEKE